MYRQSRYPDLPSIVKQTLWYTLWWPMFYFASYKKQHLVLWSSDKSSPCLESKFEWKVYSSSGRPVKVVCEEWASQTGPQPSNCPPQFSKTNVFVKTTICNFLPPPRKYQLVVALVFNLFCTETHFSNPLTQRTPSRTGIKQTQYSCAHKKYLLATPPKWFTAPLRSPPQIEKHCTKTWRPWSWLTLHCDKFE